MLLASSVFCWFNPATKPGSLALKPDWTIFWLMLVLDSVPPTFTVCTPPFRLNPPWTLPPTSAPEPLFKFFVPPSTSPTTVRPGTA
ncbi:Uncharacterised protein [Sphingomonas paucimobilis]|nr:Uncharacterised protein [Sphingomonas paucimobilis]